MKNKKCLECGKNIATGIIHPKCYDVVLKSIRTEIKNLELDKNGY